MSNSFKRVLIIGFVWPEPSSSAAGKRMMQLISYFVGHNCDVTFASTAKKSKFTTDLTVLGIQCESIKVNDSGFDSFASQLNPDVVVFDRFMTEEQFGWRVSEQCPDAARILDTEDLHSLRYAREQAFKNGDDRIQTYLTSDVAKRELASIYRCDLSFIISESEMKLLTDFFRVPYELLHYLPFLIDPITEEIEKGWPDFDHREGFMTIGNFRHKPNLDAVGYLRSEIWPLIRQLMPDAVMNVYGAYLKQQVEEWHKPSQGFLIHGRANNANVVMKASRVCLAPLRFGAGLKGKLIEAMINGTPSVTTSMGAEGICGTMDWPGAIADNPEYFANAAVECYGNRGIWSASQKKGREIINNRFSKSHFLEELTKRLNRLRKELDLHRRYNFTGAMLMHHTAASTRFMSKWIEEKNKDENK